MQSKFDHAFVRTGRCPVSSLTVKAQQGTIEGNILEKESVHVNKENGMLLKEMYFTCKHFFFLQFLHNQNICLEHSHLQEYLY